MNNTENPGIYGREKKREEKPAEVQGTGP